MRGPDEPADGILRNQEQSLLASSFAGASWRLDLPSCTLVVKRTKAGHPPDRPDPSGKQEAATWCIIHLQVAALNTVLAKNKEPAEPFTIFNLLKTRVLKRLLFHPTNLGGN